MLLRSRAQVRGSGFVVGVCRRVYWLVRRGDQDQQGNYERYEEFHIVSAHVFPVNGYYGS